MQSTVYRNFASVMRLLGVGLVTISLLTGSASAFDTGHHVDLTSEVLRREGFGINAIKVVQVENWFVDYFAEMIDTPISIRPAVREELKKLHFDNLSSTAEVGTYWARLAFNTNIIMGTIAKEAAENPKPDDRNKATLKFLTLIGASLHAVQDFYSHSNWVETHSRVPRITYRTETWFNSSVQGLDIHTGQYPSTGSNPRSHGTYSGPGLNKDSYVRPGWEEAYVFAYVASREWVQAIRMRAMELKAVTGVDLWKMAQEYLNTTENCGTSIDDLESDFRAMYHVSLYVTLGQDGHWKGNHSGSFMKSAAAMDTWQKGWGHSTFVQEVLSKYTSVLVATNLDDRRPPPASQLLVLPLNIDERAIILRTLKVGEVTPSPRDACRPDYYARITVGDQMFIEAINREWQTVPLQWKTIRFVPTFTTSVPLTYQLWSEQIFASCEGPGSIRPPLSDSHHDINLGAGLDLIFVFNTTTNVCEGLGRPCSESQPFVVQWPDSGLTAPPDGKRANVSFHVTSRALTRPQ